jgi:hypothetical protein
MTGGVGSVRGLTVMIATEGIFVWCAVTPAHKRVQALPIMPLLDVNTVGAPL